MRKLIEQKIKDEIDYYNERWEWSGVMEDIPDFEQMSDEQVMLALIKISKLNSVPMG